MFVHLLSQCFNYHLSSYNKANYVNKFLKFIFGIKLYMFWTVPLPIIRSLLTALKQAVSKHVWHIPLLSVQWKTPDDGQRNRPKHIEFYSKNKFEKLVHLVGSIIRIYHDARSSEHQIPLKCCLVHENNTHLPRGDSTSLAYSQHRGHS